MSQVFPQLDELRVTVDAVTRERHLSVIRAAIREQRAPRLHRLRLLVIALVLALVFPVVAVAAEQTVPGDFLYPVKRLVEPVLELVDRDVVAEHRVEEVETLFERDAPARVILDHVDVARDVVSDDHPHLTDRVDRVTSDLAEREADHQDLPLHDEKPDRARHDQGVAPTDAVGEKTTTTVHVTDTPRHQDRPAKD